MKKKTVKTIDEAEKFVTGLITSVNVNGIGPNSAQLLFVVHEKIKDVQVAIMVTSDYEPQVFASMANFVTAAYFARKPITAGYITRAGETSRAVAVFTPVVAVKTSKNKVAGQ